MVVQRNELFGPRTSLSQLPNGFRRTLSYRYRTVIPLRDVGLVADASSHLKTVARTSSGTSTSTQNGFTKTIDHFSYPLCVNFTAFDPEFKSCKSKSINYPSSDKPPSFAGQAEFDQSYQRLFSPSPFVLTSNIRSHQTAHGYLVRTPDGTTGNGANENQFSYGDAEGNTYWRRVNAAYNHITYDREGGSLARGHSHPWGIPTPDAQNVAGLEDSFRLPGGRYGE